MTKLYLFNNKEILIGTITPLEAVQQEEINKIQILEARVPYKKLIDPAAFIGHKDYKDKSIFHLYKIDNITKSSLNDVKISAVHTFFDDMGADGYIEDYRPTDKTLIDVFTTLLNGSRWQVGLIKSNARVTTSFYYLTRKDAISKVIDKCNIEIKPRIIYSNGRILKRYIDVYDTLGRDTGKVYVAGNDLLTVAEKNSKGAIYTAAVGRGKGEETDSGGYGRKITFADVEWRTERGNPVDKPKGQKFVELKEATKIYGFDGIKPRVKLIEFGDEESPENLLRLTYEWLVKNSRLQTEYKATVRNTGNCDLGDTVGIVKSDINIKYKTRVFKITRNLLNNNLTEFGVGDKVVSSPFERNLELAKDLANLENRTIYWLDGLRNKLIDGFLNEAGYNYDLKADNAYNLPAGYYSFNKPIDQNPTKVIYMGAGNLQ